MSDLIDRLRAEAEHGQCMEELLTAAADQIAALTARLEAAEARAVVDDAMVWRALGAKSDVASPDEIDFEAMHYILTEALTPPATETKE